MIRAAGLRRVGLVLAAAGLAASAVVALPAAALADAPPLPSFTTTLTPDNVVPGPGQAGAEDQSANMYVSGNAGELCWYANLSVVADPTSAGVYEGTPGTAGTLMFALPFTWHGSWGSTECAEGLDQATIDAIASNPAGYYMQVNSVAYPDGASRGQLQAVVPGFPVLISTYICANGTRFSSDPAAPLPPSCGSVSQPNDVAQPWPGTTTTGYAGAFAIDYRVQGVSGYGQTINPDEPGIGGAPCDPDTLICRMAGQIGYTWFPPVGPITVDPLVAPAGARLAHWSLAVESESEVPSTLGPNGHIGVDMTGRYNGLVFIKYFYTAPARVTPPAITAPIVHLGAGSVAADGEIPLELTYAATERGTGPVRYEIEVQRDGGHFHAEATTRRPVTTIREDAGHTYVFRVRVTDDSGIKSDWAVGQPVRLDVIQDDSELIAYTGSWQVVRPGPSFGPTVTTTSEPYAAFNVSFDATEMALVMPTRPGGGGAYVQTSSGDSAQLDLSSTHAAARQIVYKTTFWSGTGNSVSLQVNGTGPVSLDAIVLLR